MGTLNRKSPRHRPEIWTSYGNLTNCFEHILSTFWAHFKEAASLKGNNVHLTLWYSESEDKSTLVHQYFPPNSCLLSLKGHRIFGKTAKSSLLAQISIIGSPNLFYAAIGRTTGLRCVQLPCRLVLGDSCPLPILHGHHPTCANEITGTDPGSPTYSNTRLA